MKRPCRPFVRRSRRCCWIAAIGLSLACQPEVFPVETTPAASRTDVPPDPKVVVFVIDGPGYPESFGDPVHAHIPRIWDELRPLGTVCTTFRNFGSTATVSGHASMLTGVWQALDNEGLERPLQPTLFEYYRKATGAPPADALLVAGKPKLDACTHGLHSEYGAAFAAQADLGHATDLSTYQRLIERLDADVPHLVVVSFSQVDQKGHSGVFADYVRQIEIVDSLAVLTWSYLQSDPDYAGQTYLFITSDHGRHDAAHGGFQNHGDDCPGCRSVIFLALGPDVRIGYEVTTLYTQRDLCATVGHVLGVATPYAQGFVIDEIFVPVSTGVMR